jgi:hypothetical protein
LLLLDVLLRYCALPQSAAVVHDGLAQAVCCVLGSSPLTAQVLHVCCPRVSWYWSGGQLVQVPSLVPYLPKSQPLQVAAPGVVVVRPGLHRWHWVASLSFSFRANPTGHCWQPWPNVPAPQATHLALPLSDDQPSGQSSHLKDPSVAAFVSLSHSSHASLLLDPVVGFFIPAAQLLHWSGLVKPVADEYVPCGHPMQAVLATAPISVEYKPAGHSVVYFEKQGYRGVVQKHVKKRKSIRIKVIKLHVCVKISFFIPNQFQNPNHFNF